MTNGLGRVYATTLAIVVFFLSWAVIAAKPWVSAPAAKTDPRILALNARGQRLHRDAIQIRAIVQKRWTVYQAQLVRRKHVIAARKKAQQALVARQTALAAQQARYVPPASSSASAPQAAASAPSAPIVRVAPPAAPPATQTKTS